MITIDSSIKFERKNYNDEILLSLYKELIKPRMIDEKIRVGGFVVIPEEK